MNLQACRIQRDLDQKLEVLKPAFAQLLELTDSKDVLIASAADLCVGYVLKGRLEESPPNNQEFLKLLSLKKAIMEAYRTGQGNKLLIRAMAGAILAEFEEEGLLPPGTRSLILESMAAALKGTE